jgi:hypothetical protein
MFCQVRSGEIQLDQVTAGFARLGQIISEYVRSFYVWPLYCRVG